MPEIPKKPAFETKLDELNALIKSLEKGDLGLEEAIATFERGRTLHQALVDAALGVRAPDRGADPRPRRAGPGAARARPRSRARARCRHPRSDGAGLIARVGAVVERELDRLLPRETESPAEIHRAMRYSVFPAGNGCGPRSRCSSARRSGSRRPTSFRRRARSS